MGEENVCIIIFTYALIKNVMLYQLSNLECINICVIKFASNDSHLGFSYSSTII